MNIKHSLKKSHIFVKSYEYLREILTMISPELNTRITFYIAKGKKINLKSPKTFEEKILWLKLNKYSNNPLVTKCADKYQVRSYIKDCGYEMLLNELIGVWDTVDEIEWDTLPNEFALKCNHASGYNIICDDKSRLDIEKVKIRLKRWMKKDQWKSFAEVNYKNIQKKIICEKYLKTNQGFLPNDYKVYCFNGIPKVILVIIDRDKDTKAVFMSLEWKVISYSDIFKYVSSIPEKPHSLDTMINAAAKLSKPFPFVRVDFYQYNNRAIFGEMTFTPAGGLYVAQTEINGVAMSELIDIL